MIGSSGTSALTTRKLPQGSRPGKTRSHSCAKRLPPGRNTALRSLRCVSGSRLEQLSDLGLRMPVSAAVRPDASASAFLQIQQTVAVEQSEDEAPAGHAHHFREGARLFADKAERGDGNAQVERSRRKRQRARIAEEVRLSRRGVRCGEAQHIGIRVDPGDANMFARKAARKVSAAAADIEKAFPGSGCEDPRTTADTRSRRSSDRARFGTRHRKRPHP